MRRALLAAAVTLSTGALVATASPVLAAPPQPTQPSPAPSTVPDRYLNQSIDWQPCFPGGAPEGLPPGSDALECGTFTAPRDWDNPAAQTDVTIAVSRLPAADGEAEGGATFTNPGGPGGPGQTTPLIFLQAGRDRLLNSQDIYGIDVRGTGLSTGVTCNGGAATGIDLDPRDRSTDNTNLILDSAELVAQFCQTGSGEFSPFVRTDQTVRDLDLMRALVDQEKINWVGYSGGTWLGAYYATYFPDRVGRFVLDANTAFTEPWQQTFGLQPLGFQRRFEEDFQRWAAGYDAQLDLGTTPQEVDRSYEDLRAALAAQPLDLGLGLAIYAVDLDGLIAQNMYSKTQFQSLAETIRLLRDEVAARQDPAAPAPTRSAAVTDQLRADVEQGRAVRARAGGNQPLAPDSFEATFLHILCNDTPWDGTRESLLAESERDGEAYPLIGWSTLAQPCISWDRPQVDLLQPDGKGVPPVLMVQNDKDPATPIEGAKIAQDGFEGARMLTVTNEGDHTTYASGTPNTCVDDAVEDYLVDGVVPAADSSCPGVPIPPPVAASPETRVQPSQMAGTPQQRNAELARLAGLG